MALQLHFKNRLNGYRFELPSSALVSCRWILIQLYNWAGIAGGWATWMRTSSTFRFSIEVATVLGVFITLVSFWIDRDARKENRVHQAWSLVASNEGGNIGLIRALEFLHNEEIVLSSIKLSKVHLYGVKLPEANLNHANFEDAELSKSELAGVSLRNARLSFAGLRSADLADADLTKADFTGANLNDANLRGASFDEAIFAGATLRRAKLSTDQLSGARLCGTTLPDESLSDRDCAKLRYECDTALANQTAQADRMHASCKWLDKNRGRLRFAYGEW